MEDNGKHAAETDSARKETHDTRRCEIKHSSAETLSSLIIHFDILDFTSYTTPLFV
jgi:GTP cyclohydrolase III